MLMFKKNSHTTSHFKKKYNKKIVVDEGDKCG